jgi:hypothetical protein
LRISRTPHSQSSGIAREACALKGERCVFYERDINLEVFNLETDFFGDLHCSSRFTDMLCDAQAQYGDYSELDECPMWRMWVKEGGEGDEDSAGNRRERGEVVTMSQQTKTR